MPQEYINKMLYAGKMNRDVSPEFVKEGDYVYALNLRPYSRITQSSDVGTNIEGNTLVDYDFGVAESTLRCVGSKLDSVRKRVYWLVHSNQAPSKAFVLYYDYKTREVVTVFSYNNILGFDREVQIKDINIVYDAEFGDTLLWVGKGEPRKLNVNAGVNRFNNYNDTAPYAIGQYTFADYVDNPYQNALLNIPFIAITNNSSPPEYDYSTGEFTNNLKWQQEGMNACYPPFLFETMFYQKPITPYFSPNAAYHYNNSQPSRAVNILEKSYEFCYKNIYFDGQESEWSPKSEATFPTGLTSLIFDSISGLVDLEYNNADYVEVRVPINITRSTNESTFAQQPHSMIARVLIAVREVPSKYAPGDWYQLANIAVEDFHRHNISTDAVSSSFPIPNTSGTYYYNWDINSYFQNTQLTRVVTITYRFDGSHTLVPIDVQDAQALFYNVPREARTQELAVNRVIWGSVLENMRIKKSIYDSIVDNLSISIVDNLAEFSTEEAQTEVGTFIPDDPFASIEDAGKTVRFQSTLNIPFDNPDYQQTLIFNMNLVLLAATSESIGLNYNMNISGSLYGGLTGSGYVDMEAFLQDVFETAFAPYSGQSSITVTFNEGTGQITIDMTILGTDTVTLIVSANLSSSPFSFYTEIDARPIRTLKNHSQQQLGIVLQDNAGRLTPVITGEWAKFNVGHFVNDDLDTIFSQIKIESLSDISVPVEAKVMHIVKKRSGSYRNFVQFAISKGNCLQQSWNYGAPYYIGFLDLTLDEFDASSFQDDPKNLYITLNSITGGAGGSYDVLRERVSTGLAATNIDRFNRDPRESNTPGVQFGANDDGTTPRNGSGTTNRGGVVTNPSNDPSNPAEIMPEDISIRYQPTDGDVVRFLYRMDDGDSIVEKYSELFPIIGFNDKWNTITLNWNDVNTKEPLLGAYLSANNTAAKGGTLTVRILAEIINKPTKTENDFYWECAAQLSCNNGSVEISPAADFLDVFGDVYIKPRGNAVAYNFTSFTAQNFTVLDMNYNDFYPSANSGEGRPNIVVNSVQKQADYQSEVRRANLLVYSEKSVQNTDIRNYGTVYDVNIQEVDNSFGAVEQIDSEGDKILIYQEDKMSYAFLERAMTKELSGSQRVISSQNQIISDVVYQSFNGGISKDGNTFAKKGYQKYFVDSKRGVVIRESLNGITEISEVGMSGEFKKLFAAIRASYITPIMRGITHDVYDEYILQANYSKKFQVEVYNVVSGFAKFDLPIEFTDGSRSVYFNQSIMYADITNTNPYTPKKYPILSRTGQEILFQPDSGTLEDGDTITVELLVSQVFVWSEKNKGWSYYLGYTSEWSETGVQSYHTFVNGQMWLHDIDNTNYNNFHGMDSDSELILADGDANTNRWLTAGVKTNQQPYAKDISTSLEMQSSIPLDFFKKREGVYWGAFLRDSASQGGLYNGDYLKGRWMLIKFVWSGVIVHEKQLKVFGAAFNREKSDFTV